MNKSYYNRSALIAALFAICTFSLTGCMSFTSKPSIPPEHRPGASVTVTTTGANDVKPEVVTDMVVDDSLSSDGKDEEPTEVTTASEAKAEHSTTAEISSLPSDSNDEAAGEYTVPEIAFISVNSHYGEEDEHSLQVTFFDKEGNYYASDDSDFCILSFEDKIEYLRSGGGENIRKLPQTCDKAEIVKYNKLLHGLKSEMDVPEVMPDVEAGHRSVFGLYYDDDGKLCSVTLHEKERMTDIYSKDSTANEIYEWYMEAIKVR